VHFNYVQEEKDKAGTKKGKRKIKSGTNGGTISPLLFNKMPKWASL
jgi:hypothetical protein